MKASSFHNTPPQHENQPTTPQQIEEALQYIIPDMEREEWAKIAMAIKSELADEGFEIFDTWSQGADNYQAVDASDTWRSINGSGGITIATLFRLAIDGGYKPEKKEVSPAERARMAQQQAARTAERKAEARQEQSAREKSQQKAAEQAQQRWNAAGPVNPEHPYLVARKIAGIGLKQDGNTLLTPMRDAAEKLWNVERITAPGKPKKGLRGGRRKALFCRIPGSASIVISEGFATAESCHLATGWTAICAFGTSNLGNIARITRERKPDARIIIAGDVGSEECARKAAAVCSGEVAIPDMEKDNSDFNDLYRAKGLEAVKAALEQAEPVDTWEEPEDLVQSAEPNVYPVDSLGEILGPAAKAIHSDTQAPLETCGQSVLTAAAVSAQPYYNVRAPHGTVSPLSLYALTESASGERKSAADKLAMFPVRKLELALEEIYAEELSSWCSENEAWKVARLEALAKSKKKGKTTKADFKEALDGVGTEPLKPLHPHLTAEDPTVEGIFRSLNEGFPSQGCFTDEGGLLIGGHALNADNMLKTASRLSKLWEGDPFDRTRGGDERKKLYDRRLSLHWLFQPQVAAQLFEHKILEAQGLFPRCLLANPPEMAGTREYRKVSHKTHPDIKTYWAALDELLKPDEWPIHEKDCQRLQPKTIETADSEFQLIKEWFEHYEKQIGASGELVSVQVFVSRMLEQALRIAGVLTAVEKGRKATEISKKNLKRGMKLAEYSVGEWERMKIEADIPTDVRLAKLLLEWIQETNRRIVHSREISRLGPNRVRKMEDRDKAIDVLVKRRWLRAVPGGKEIEGKHRKYVWEVYCEEIRV